MHQRSIVLILLLATLGLGSLIGCDSAPDTTMAPKGHDGNAHGKIDASAERTPTKYTGPRR